MKARQSLQKNEEDISAVLKTKPISNLNDAIGVNDKFLFIREIFGGNQASYDDAIYRLNNVTNLPDAKAIIMSYTGEGDENEAVKQLLDLVKRKLPSDEQTVSGPYSDRQPQRYHLQGS